MRVLIVDDDEIALRLLEHTLARAGHEVDVARDGVEALDMLREGRHRVVVSDWEMSEMNGIELCRRVRERRYMGYVYFILVTGRGRPSDVVEGLGAGADDFITKPFIPAELCMRVRTAERILALDNIDMTILALAKLADSRDNETGSHLERVREYCRVIARHLSRQPDFAGLVDDGFIDAVYSTSPLHDIGKVGIPDSILLKPGKLTPEEFAVMQSHTTIGAETLDAALREHPEVRLLGIARDIALTHHERFDGSGYPQGLRSEEIPLCGRIVALADVYDALTTKRVYKEAYSHETAREIILEGRGSHFDPRVVDAFVANEGMFLVIHQGLSDHDEAEPAPRAKTREVLVNSI